MEYKLAMEKADYSKIDKLNKLQIIETFWEDVRKLTRNVTSCHGIRRWEILANLRYKELKGLPLDEE